VRQRWPAAWWLTARSGRLQRLAGRKDRGKRPTANAWPGRGRIGQPCRNWGGRKRDYIPKGLHQSARR
jgi:hypothetical protein